MKTVLFLTYYYPPLANIGSVRTFNLARDLTGLGWRFVVVAPATSRQPIDPGFSGALPPPSTVLRTGRRPRPGKEGRSGELTGSRASSSARRAMLDRLLRAPGAASAQKRLRELAYIYLYIPDGQIGWLPGAIRAAERAIRRERIDLVYSSAFPMTAHLAGYYMKKRYGIPWVAEFRDLWADTSLQLYESRWRKGMDRRIEDGILRYADRTIVVSEPHREIVVNRVLAGRPDDVMVLPNGYDPGMFDGIEPAPKEKGKLRLVYTGTFHGGKRNFAALYQALSQIFEAGEIPRDRVEVALLGPGDETNRQLVEKWGMGGVVREMGMQSRRVTASWQLSADLLLFIIWTVNEAMTRGIISGKLFEYLKTGRPILALTPEETEAGAIVQRSRTGRVLRHDDVEGIREALLDYYGLLEKGKPLLAHADDDVIGEYAYPVLARKVDRLFKGLFFESPSAGGEY